MGGHEARAGLVTRAVQVAVGYALAAGVWIVATDLLTAGSGGEAVSSIAKGLVFVGVTAVVLGWVLVRQARRLEAAGREERRARSAEELSAGIDALLLGGGSWHDALDAACRGLVEQLGCRLAWAGWAEPDGTIRPAAMAGPARAFLTDNPPLRWRDDGHGVPATGLAIATGRTQIGRLDDPGVRRWRSAAEQHGITAALGVPVLQGDEVIGVLAVYVGRVEDLDPWVVRWVEAVAARLGVTRNAAVAREAMAAGEARFRALFDASPAACWVQDPESHLILLANRATVERYGWSAEALAGMSAEELHDESERAAVAVALRTTRSGVLPGTWWHRDRAGHRRAVELAVDRTVVDGRAVQVVVAVEQTERLQAAGIERLVSDLDASLAGGAGLDVACQQVCERLVTLFDLPLAWVGLRRADGRLDVLGRAGSGAKLIAARADADGALRADGPLTQALHTGAVQRTQPTDDAAVPWRRRAEHFGIAGQVVVPLPRGGESAGVLVAGAGREADLDPAMVEHLIAVAGRLGLGLGVAADQQRLHLLAAAVEVMPLGVALWEPVAGTGESEEYTLVARNRAARRLPGLRDRVAEVGPGVPGGDDPGDGDGPGDAGGPGPDPAELVAVLGETPAVLAGRLERIGGSLVRSLVPAPERPAGPARGGEPEGRASDGPGDDGRPPVRQLLTVRVFLLPGRTLGVTVEDVTERERAEWVRRDLLARLERVEADARQRLADDLHDGPIQLLVALGLRLGTLRRRLAAGGDVAPEALAGLEELARQGSEALRRLLFELSPPPIEAGGIAEAIASWADFALAESGVTVQVEDTTDTPLPAAIGETAYRIAREALANVRNHAQASLATVRLRPADGGFEVVVTDDGVGIDAAASQASVPGHLGLRSMRQRAWAAGGRIDVRRRETGGTEVRVWLPDPGRAGPAGREGVSPADLPSPPTG